jgi:hypothetical protein
MLAIVSVIRSAGPLSACKNRLISSLQFPHPRGTRAISSATHYAFICPNAEPMAWAGGTLPAIINCNDFHYLLDMTPTPSPLFLRH